MAGIKELNKKKASKFVDNLENTNPTADAFQGVKRLMQGGTFAPPQTDMQYNPQTRQMEPAIPFNPDSFKTTTDTSLERQKADAILNQMRGIRPESKAIAQPGVPGDVKALVDQQQYMQQLKDFDQAGPDEEQKLQRIKEMLKQK